MPNKQDVIALLATLSNPGQKRASFLSSAFGGKKLQEGNPAGCDPSLGGPTPSFRPKSMPCMAAMFAVLSSAAHSHPGPSFCVARLSLVRPCVLGRDWSLGRPVCLSVPRSRSLSVPGSLACVLVSLHGPPSFHSGLRRMALWGGVTACAVPTSVLSL